MISPQKFVCLGSFSHPRKQHRVGHILSSSDYPTFRIVSCYQKHNPIVCLIVSTDLDNHTLFVLPVYRTCVIGEGGQGGLFTRYFIGGQRSDASPLSLWNKSMSSNFLLDQLKSWFWSKRRHGSNQVIVRKPSRQLYPLLLRRRHFLNKYKPKMVNAPKGLNQDLLQKTIFSYILLHKCYIHKCCQNVCQVKMRNYFKIMTHYKLLFIIMPRIPLGVLSPTLPFGWESPVTNS